MKNRIISIAVVFILLISSSVYAINFKPEETYDSVVVVYTDTGVGSGFSIKENLIITNAHVVGITKNVKVNLYDGTTIGGTVIKTDEEKDLALIQVNKSIKPLTLNGESLSIGQEVYAIGAPKDMAYTMTKGIISALDRKLGKNTYIQVDASINSGNSGGPLVDENGNAIGVITLKASNAEGIGFAITVKDVNNFIDGIEPSPENAPKDDAGESNIFPDADSEEYSTGEKALMIENDILKIGLCISVMLNIVLVILYIYLLFKKRTKKEKDEFDFEIEIEE